MVPPVATRRTLGAAACDAAAAGFCAGATGAAGAGRDGGAVVFFRAPEAAHDKAARQSDAQTMEESLDRIGRKVYSGLPEVPLDFGDDLVDAARRRIDGVIRKCVERLPPSKQ